MKISTVLVVLLTTTLASNAVTILSGPSFSPASKAPLAGVLSVTTDVASRVSVLVSDGTNSWQKDYYDFATSHALPVLGFKPGRTNQMMVTVYDVRRNAQAAPQALSFITSPLPTNMAHSAVIKSE